MRSSTDIVVRTVCDQFGVAPVMHAYPLPQHPHVCFNQVPEDSSVLAGTEKTFCFDSVFGPASTQGSVYKAVVAPLLQRFLGGYNATVMAYGQTASGKTFTMGTTGSYVALRLDGVWWCARGVW